MTKSIIFQRLLWSGITFSFGSSKPTFLKPNCCMGFYFCKMLYRKKVKNIVVKQVWEIHSLYPLRDIQCTLALNSLGSPSIKKLH